MRFWMNRGLWVMLVVTMGCGWSSSASSADSSTMPSNTVSSDTVASIRQQMVEYMRAMATVAWTPQTDITYWSSSLDFTFSAGEVYRGIPYTQNVREVNLEKFDTVLQKNADEVSVYIGPVTADQYWGSDCSSAVSMAWQLVDSTIPLWSTYDMFPGDNPKIIAVGDYQVTSFKSTKQIVSDNGPEKMFEAYAQLQPGDAMMRNFDGHGHVVLISRVDPEHRTVSIIEQSGVVAKTGKLKGDDSSWRADAEMNYDEIFRAQYIPITLKELTLSPTRQQVVRTMRVMATIAWTPQNDIPYWSPDRDFRFQTGEVYYGLPYTQRTRDTTLKTFEESLQKLDSDGKTFEFPVYTGPIRSATYLGSDCSGSLCLAWRQIDPDFPMLMTFWLYPIQNRRVAPVGDYRLTSFESTLQIVADNGLECIHEAYTKLQPGDAVLTNHDGDGHVMLVVSVDPQRRQVTLIDQTGMNSKGLPKGRDGHSTWRVDHTLSFDDLSDGGYIPITHVLLF